MKQNLDVSQIITEKRLQSIYELNVYRFLLCTLAEVLYFHDRHEKKVIGSSGPIIGFLCSKLEILESLRVAKYSSRDQYFDAFYL